MDFSCFPNFIFLGKKKGQAESESIFWEWASGFKSTAEASNIILKLKQFINVFLVFCSALICFNEPFSISQKVLFSFLRVIGQELFYVDVFLGSNLECRKNYEPWRFLVKKARFALPDNIKMFHFKSIFHVPQLRFSFFFIDFARAKFSSLVDKPGKYCREIESCIHFYKWIFNCFISAMKVFSFQPPPPPSHQPLPLNLHGKLFD